MPMFMAPPSRAGTGRGRIASQAPCQGEVNPEHAIRLSEARCNEVPRVDGLESDVRGQLQHSWLVRIVVAADKYDGPLKAGMPITLTRHEN
jgi:hypothetical protein